MLYLQLASKRCYEVVYLKHYLMFSTCQLLVTLLELTV